MKLAVYYDLARGGGAAALGRFVAFLRRGHQVDVFAPADAWPITADTQRLDGFAAGSRFLGRSSFAARFARAGSRKLARRERELARSLESYSLVLVHTCRDRGAPALLSALGERAVFYVTEPLRLYREGRPPDGESPLLWWASRAALLPFSSAWNAADRKRARAPRRLLANSRYTRTRVEVVYGREAAVVPPSVDPFFLETPPGTGDGNFVLSPGALLPQKGHGRILRALARWPRRPPLVVAGYAGPARYRKRLEKAAGRLGVPLRIRANVPREELRELVRAARVVAIGAWREPFGLVALEAQAAGRPVVAVDEGGLPETLLPGRTGLVAPPEPEPLAEAIRSLWEDRPRAERFGRAGRDHVREAFSPEACGARLEQELRQGVSP